MRDRFNAFVDRHDVAWELAMALLAVVYVAVGFALDDEAFQSMAPTLHSGSLYVLDTSYYRHNPIQRGDIVLFRYRDETCTKRV